MRFEIANLKSQPHGGWAIMFLSAGLFGGLGDEQFCPQEFAD